MLGPGRPRASGASQGRSTPQIPATATALASATSLASVTGPAAFLDAAIAAPGATERSQIASATLLRRFRALQLCFPGLCNAHNAPRSQLQLLPEPLNAPRSLHQQRSSAHSAYSQCRQSFLQRSDASGATGTLLHRATCLTLPLYDRGILHRKEPHGWPCHCTSRATGTLLHRATCLPLPLYDQGILHRKEPHGWPSHCTIEESSTGRKTTLLDVITLPDHVT